MKWLDNLDRIKAENKAWRAEHGPRLRERDRLQEEQRNRAKAAWATLSDEQKQALRPYAPTFIAVNEQVPA